MQAFRLIAAFAFLVVLTLPVFGQEETPSIGERFHKETSLTWSGALADEGRSKPLAPPKYKEYPDAVVVELPEPSHDGITVEKALRQRRSRREYTGGSISLLQLSQILFAAQGKTGTYGDRIMRTAPSAGALYPFEIYIVAGNVDGLAPGLYHYSVRDHALETVRQGDLQDEISDAALNQEPFENFAAVFVLAARINRTRSKYGERAYRYVYMEAGHISQNIFLEATSLGIGSVCVGAFRDRKVNELIGADGKEEITVYLHVAGKL